MEVLCIFEAWDSVNARHYTPGIVPDFDPNNLPVANLTVPGGSRYAFQWPGHDVVPGRDPKEKILARAPAPVAAAPVVVEAPEKPKQKMSDEHKKKMVAARQKKRAEKAARLAAIAEESAV